MCVCVSVFVCVFLLCEGKKKQPCNSCVISDSVIKVLKVIPEGPFSFSVGEKELKVKTDLRSFGEPVGIKVLQHLPACHTAWSLLAFVSPNSLPKPLQNW